MRWALLLCVAASGAFASAQGTELSEKEKRDGWVLLFDGKTMFGWKGGGDVKVADNVARFDANARIESNFKLPGPCALVVDAPGARLALHDPVDGGSVKTDAPLVLPDEWGWKAREYRTLILFGNKMTLRSAKLRPTDMKPIFNGDNLDGWTVFPGKKSKFEAKDGEIQLHDGPGDLQTTAKYRNFILQLECKSNGKHLNSGVFFRCRANEYQNGYECQIQNGFAKEKDYTVDVFDPMTHKLLEKTKVKSGAIDYGTGAIYRRVPARSEVAKDHEWFTLTVLAVDNHFATWVDGIQEVDWTDNRPANDNARNGYRSEAGHVSLQGHDPTTNLSFRNLRIQELP